MRVVTITPENAEDHGFFCIRNIRSPGFRQKHTWFRKRHKEGLTIKQVYAEDGRPAGFIEYVPGEYAWRPVAARGHLFVHCLFVYPNKYRNSGVATMLLEASISEARNLGLQGVCAMTSDQPWMATRSVFLKTGFIQQEKRRRFELLLYRMGDQISPPEILPWEERLPEYPGWHLLYADQCPWHAKGVAAIRAAAGMKGFQIHIQELNSAAMAQQAPSGTGTFALVHDGRLLADHYISERRFLNIVEKEIAE